MHSNKSSMHRPQEDIWAVNLGDAEYVKVDYACQRLDACILSICNLLCKIKRTETLVFRPLSLLFCRGFLSALFL